MTNKTENIRSILRAMRAYGTDRVTVTSRQIADLRVEFGDDAIRPISGGNGNRFIIMNQIPIEVIEDADVEKHAGDGAILLCLRALENGVLRMPGNKIGFCSKCGHAVEYSPYMPEVTKHCNVC